MSKHFFALFIFFAVVTSGCDQFCQIPQHVDLEFCLVLAELEDRNENPQPVECQLDCAGTYGAVCVDDGDGEGVCECPEGLLEEPLGRCVTHEACEEAIGLTPNESTGECVRDAEDQTVHVSVTPSEEDSLHNGRVQILEAQIFAEEEEEIEILSLSIEVFTSELVLDPMIRLWIGEDLGFITPLVSENDAMYTATFFVEDGPVYLEDEERTVRVYAGISEAQDISAITTCLSSIQYRSTTTGIEYDIDFGREHCQTIN